MLFLVLALLALPLLAGAVFVATFDADAQRPRVTAAVEAATGRVLTLGRIGLAFTPLPTVTIADVALANAPGGSRPEMLRVARAEASVALWPLLVGEVVIRRLTLQAPDLLLETDAQGRPNWSFDPPARAGATDAPAAARVAGQALGVQVDTLAVTAARVTWRDARADRVETLDIASLTADPRGATGLLDIVGTLAIRAVPIRVTGEVGDLRRLAEASGTAPWPFRLAAETNGARLTAEGEAAAPMQGRGWRAALTATVPALQSLAPLAPTVPLPALRGVLASATITDGADGAISLRDLTLEVAESDLGALLPGLVLTRLTAGTAPAQPFRLDAAGRVGALPLRAEATLGRAVPTPIDLRVHAGDAVLTAIGTVPLPPAETGTDLVVTLRAPPQPGWPTLGAIEGSTRLALPGPGLAGGVTLSALSLTSAGGDLAGEARIRPGERPTVEAQLASRRLDLAALRPPPATQAPGPAAAQPTASPAPARRIPDVTLPFDLLRRIDATIGWSIAELVASGTIFRAATIEASVAAGRLQLAAAAPAGALRLVATADAAATPPTLHVTAAAAGAEAATLLAAAGAPGTVAGRLDLDVDLRGAGAGLRAIAATAVGHAGVALVDGRADASLLRGLPSEARQLLLPPGAATADGALPLRCVALRANVTGGVATLASLLLDLPIGRIGGAGTVNLADETLAIRLNPDIRVGPIQLRAPVRVSGTLAAPRIAVPVESAVAGGLGALLSLQRSADRGLQELAGAFGGEAPPDCPTALGLARGGRQGPMPAASGAAPIPEVTRELERRLPAPIQDVFRGLLNR